MTQKKKLGTREREVLDILYRLGSATVAEVLEVLPDPPTYDAVRTTLRILEEKKVVRHLSDGPRYVYQPIVPQERAQRDALHHVIETFFGGSLRDAALALLGLRGKNLTRRELEQLERWIDEEGKKE